MAVSSQYNADTSRSFVRLREGAEDAHLFLFPGGDGNPHGLAALASRIRKAGVVIGIDYCRRDNLGQLPSTIDIMADHSCSVIRALQPHGPYCVAGYSFGGLVAIEVARALQDAGEEIALLALIDTFLDIRFWPTRIFLKSQARIVHRHLAIIFRQPLDQMIPLLLYRSKRLFSRVLRRQLPTSLRIAKPKTVAATTLDHCVTIMKDYRPQYYAGNILFFTAENHDDFGCDAAELWRRMATKVESRTISGTHVGIVAEETAIAEVAAALDSYLSRDAEVSCDLSP